LSWNIKNSKKKLTALMGSDDSWHSYLIAYIKGDRFSIEKLDKKAFLSLRSEKERKMSLFCNSFPDI